MVKTQGETMKMYALSNLDFKTLSINLVKERIQTTSLANFFNFTSHVSELLLIP